MSLRDRFGMAIVVVTHELASIEAIADKVLMLAKGRIIADGSLDMVMKMDNPVVRAFFDRVPQGHEAVRQTVLGALGGKKQA